MSARLTWDRSVEARTVRAVGAAAGAAAAVLAAASARALSTPGPPWSRPGEPPRRARGTLMRSQTSWTPAEGRARAGSRSGPEWAADAHRNRPWLRETATGASSAMMTAAAAEARRGMGRR